MDKREMRECLGSGLTVGTELSVMFRGSSVPSGKDKVSVKSGMHRVVSEPRTGRGKGGSRFVRLMNLETGEQFDLGTPASLDVVSMTVGGVVHATVSEHEDARLFEKDKERAAELKSLLSPLVGKTGVELTVASADPRFNGKFELVEAKLNPGRFGQVSVAMKGSDGSMVTLWSYRHATLIDELGYPGIEDVAGEEEAIPATEVAPAVVSV